MVRSRFMPVAALLMALAGCGDAVSTGGGGGDAGATDDAAAADSYAAAMEATCASAPIPRTASASCPAAWPTNSTRAPRVACWYSTGLVTVEELFSDPLNLRVTPAQRALILSCDVTRLPIPRGDRCTLRSVGPCVDVAVPSAYLQSLAAEVIRTGRCW